MRFATLIATSLTLVRSVAIAQAEVDAAQKMTTMQPAEQVVRPVELNGRGEAFCNAYSRVLNKFPFNPVASSQATLSEVNDIFRKPDGALWKFYKENLSRLLPRQESYYVPVNANGVSLSPEFVTFFNRVTAFADALYAGGTTDPHFTYTLKALRSDGIEGVILDLDGQQFSYSDPDVLSKTLRWQGTGAHGAKATFKRGGFTEWDTEKGLWAVFAFFNQADSAKPALAGGYILEWVMRAGKDAKPVMTEDGKKLTVRLQVDLGAFPMIFQKGYFSDLTCVADVSKR